MKSLKLYVFSFLLSLVVFSVTATTVNAQGVNDFIITSFDAVYNLDNSDPQGKLTTTENISLDFSGQNHGILRAIPQKYGNLDTSPRVSEVMRDGKPENYITYNDNDNLVVKIGNASKTITGVHDYTIKYAVENVIKFQDGYDELLWDINGDQWLQSFSSVTADIKFPGVPVAANPQVKCFSGSFGSKDHNCTVLTEVNSVKAATTKALGPGETLTVGVAFEKGYFTPLSWWERNRKIVIGVDFVLVELAILLRAYKKWQKYGKDYKSRGITVPYFGRPRRVSVLQAAYVARNSLAPQHITAAIIDLAIRGYIKIYETNERKPKHELEFIGLDDENLSKDEQKLLKDLFGILAKGQKVKLEDKKQKMSKTLSQLSDMVDEQTNKKGYYEVNPKGVGKVYGVEIGLSFFVIILGFISSAFIGPAGKVIGIIIFAIMVILGFLMPKRSKEGEMLKEHMDGLNLYLKTAEKERLAAHDAVSAPLAPRGNEPVRDVKFFEKLLPFAVVYGVEKSWSKAFADIYQEPPEWYSGQWSTFNTIALASSIGSTNKVTSSAFSSPSSSGGGGFSGGGGGGGGGGGW